MKIYSLATLVITSGRQSKMEWVTNGIFANPKSQIGYNLVALELKIFIAI
jgi:hypothetical protein